MRNPYESYYYFWCCEHCGYEDDEASYYIENLDFTEFCPICDHDSMFIKKE